MQSFAENGGRGRRRTGLGMPGSEVLEASSHVTPSDGVPG